MLSVFTIVAAGLFVSTLTVVILAVRAPVILLCDEDSRPEQSGEVSKRSVGPSEKPAARSA